jgi:hypothetical protein
VKLAFGRATIATAAIAGSLVVSVSQAAATDRYASVTGSGTACTAGVPCDIQTAAEAGAVIAGDRVIVLPGTYMLAADPVAPSVAITIEGAPGQAVPRLIATSGNALSMVGGAARRLYVESASGSSRVVDLIGASTLGEQLEVVGTGTTSAWVQVRDGSLLRDSSVWNKEFAGSAVVTGGTGGRLRNVTAIAPAAGANGVLSSASFGSTQVVSLHNVIARAPVGINAEDDGGADDVDVTVSNSNYSSIVQAPPDAVAIEGSGNQTASPLFASAATGDFHQLEGSPTIDAGSDDGFLGALDLDGAARIQGPAPDIGADEFVPASTRPPPGDTFPPDTGIRKGPKKKTFKRHFKFEFGGSEPGVTFECQLDEGGWKACTSPTEVKGLKRGKHVFAVRAIDQASNPDPTPADRRWKVIRRPKKLRN